MPGVLFHAEALYVDVFRCETRLYELHILAAFVRRVKMSEVLVINQIVAQNFVL